MRLTDLPDLTFGMSGQQVLAAWRGRRLYRPFVCGMSWSHGINLTGVDIGVFGDDNGLLGLVQVCRMTTFYRNGREGLLPHEPVVFEDIDLFYWPAAEIVDFLRDSGLVLIEGATTARVGRELFLHREPGSVCFTSVSLWAANAALAEH